VPHCPVTYTIQEQGLVAIARTEVGGGDVVLGDSSGTSETGWRRNCWRIRLSR
jgi:hypothetical protein